ncbi:hypothetical protein FNF31_00716 [Cafeteria roenbergensis]|uniref:Uncharacterized protein n=1 Tax=Cafeteria roenbergensis TaxID=33653 RepID=A0A5A8DVM0_CAFRO|nr:hypothetical protein FNF31_00716 [Cafeteria roenbergensis]KAA0171677.1 hypothetical protein FNF28_00610 [Cafeteria roenbergensis]
MSDAGRKSLFRSGNPMLADVGEVVIPHPNGRLGRVVRAGGESPASPATAPQRPPAARKGGGASPGWRATALGVTLVVLVAAVVGLLATTLAVQADLTALRAQTAATAAEHEKALAAAGLLAPGSGGNGAATPSPSPSPSARPPPPELAALVDATQQGTDPTEQAALLAALAAEERVVVALAAIHALFEASNQTTTALASQAAAHAVAMERMDSIGIRVGALEAAADAQAERLSQVQAAVNATRAAAAAAAALAQEALTNGTGSLVEYAADAQASHAALDAATSSVAADVVSLNASLTAAVERCAQKAAATADALQSATGSLGSDVRALNASASAARDQLSQAIAAVDAASAAERGQLSRAIASVNASAAAGRGLLAQAVAAVNTTLLAKLATIQLTPGPEGPAGAEGPAGPAGPPGADGLCMHSDTDDYSVCPGEGDPSAIPLKTQVATLTRLAWMQQQMMEQQVRAEGASGVTMVRGINTGSRAYHDDTDANWAAISAHDHPDYVRTIGLGEIGAAINGFPWVSRHNDYKLAMNDAIPGSRMRNLKDIELPEVPPSVLAKPSLDEQAAEMREYFKAFRDSDHAHRDYRPYFRPALCVLEVAWLDAGEDLTDPFDSERHKLAAADWEELRAKLAWMLESGHKDTNENLGFLPSSVRGIRADGSPVVANLDYRIFCHPLKDALPLNQLRLSKHLASRLAPHKPLTTSALWHSRRARFDLNPSNSGSSTFMDYPSYWQQIDSLMAQVPGRDGYSANISDYEYSSNERVSRRTYNFLDDQEPLNAGFYHRFYKTQTRDAMGRAVRRRGFSDMTMWAARTTQPQVVGAPNPAAGQGGEDDEAVHRWTWAVPLELVYMTPLMAWNPLDLRYGGSSNYNRDCGDVLAGPAGKRSGDPLDADKAFNGTCGWFFFRTPERFFDPNASATADPADTGYRVVGVLDKQGALQRVRESGTFISLPEIEGLGQIRLRYPIYPVHWEGSQAWKEVKALQTLTLETSADGSVGSASDVANSLAGIDLGLSPATVGNSHTHTLSLGPDGVEALERGETAVGITTVDNSHSHTVKVRRTKSGSKWVYEIETCDGSPSECGDGHKTLAVVS